MSWWQSDWFFFLALVVVTFLAYQPAWNGAPTWDDDNYLTPPSLQSVSGLARIWTELGTTAQYYPLIYSIFWVEHFVWGDDTLGYHLLNIVLHLVSAFLLLRILRRLEIPGAQLAVILFTLHPVQVESVAWITELKNTLSGAFFFASGFSYLHFRMEERKRWMFYALALGLFVLGLLSKTVISVLPPVLLVVHCHP